MNGDNLFATSDFHEAAYALCKGMRLAGREKQGDKVVIFLEGKDVHLVAGEYFNGGEVVAREFAEGLRSIKDFVWK